MGRKGEGKKSAGAASPAPSTAETGYVGADAYLVELPTFQGPLDLLLHLIQKHELDILDIPVSFVTEKYLAYLDMMRTLTIDVASEYLVMAATLIHIKSKMLLPQLPTDQDDPEAQEEEDPRAELVRRLLEYQKYKAAAESLGERDTLGKDVFPRGAEDVAPPGPAPFQPYGVFNLLDALEKVLSRTKVKFEHNVVFDRISITDRIMELTERMKLRRKMAFEELFDESRSTFEVIITFLAMLEMCKLKLMRIYQADAASSADMSPIHVELLVLDEDEERDVLDFASSDAAEGRTPAPRHAPDAEDAPADDDEALAAEGGEALAAEGDEAPAAEGDEALAAEGDEALADGGEGRFADESELARGEGASSSDLQHGDTGEAGARPVNE